MAFLIILIISGGLLAYFAVNNTQQVAINFLNYSTTTVPLFVVVLAALLIGIIICWIISFFGFISTSLTIFGKNSKIKEGNREIDNLNKKIRDLELENENLKGKISVKPKTE